MAASENPRTISPSDAAGAAGTYLLRDLIKGVPLSSPDEDDSEPYITCVDAWNGNLYIGTSAGQVLHYVSIPPDPSDETAQPSYIFATQLTPQFKHKQEGADAGVKQILVLPEAGKACILCNGMLNFYTLPELSPAFGGQVQQGSCSWVGGLNVSESEGQDSQGGGIVLVICLKQRLRVVRISTDGRNPNKTPTKVRDIELGGVSAIQRSGDLACVADNRTYSLLDVVNQRKNDLFSISSLAPPEQDPSPTEPPAPATPAAQRSVSQSPARQGRPHQRTTSHGGQVGRLQAEHGSPFPQRSSSRQSQSPAPQASQQESTAEEHETNTNTVVERATSAPPVAPAAVELLPANIACPTPTEFLLTTGTRLAEPGVGMFVNMDGDPTRGTLEFSSYPESLVLDEIDANELTSANDPNDPHGYVLAVVRRKVAEGFQQGLEIQRWDIDPGDPQHLKEWLPIASYSDEEQKPICGLRIASSPVELSIPEISVNLRLRRLPVSGARSEPDEVEQRRNEEEDKMASRFAQVTARVLFYSRNQVSWVTRNALVTRLELHLGSAVKSSNDGALLIDVPGVQTVINSIRGQEPGNELEFITLTYIRQKASLLLFSNLLLQTAKGNTSHELDKRFTEEALVAGDIDPRVILSLVPLLRDEILQGDQGIWIAQGLRDIIELLRRSFDADKISRDPKSVFGTNMLSILKRYLLVWRNKKGFGSVADETHVFQTVDAALLHILLLLDQNTARGPALNGSLRAELNEVVDKGVDCFDRAAKLFEQFHRLYTLSRLYQSRKMSSQVLATWKRILEGEDDKGGELVNGEHVLRKYLANIRDQGLVQEYGAWLANRNPRLGVEVFADDSAKVKFEPSAAVKILNEKAPGAVKDYLEHLVFAKHHVQYVNELIAFYLETVLNELEGQSGAREALLHSYATYRALTPPKPTYGQFMEDNSDDIEWQQSRLRLLQLIGGSHGAASEYDVHVLRQRLAPHSEELVPEMIILNGREGQHEEALRLLTHGLGDYDSAIRYCLLGGSSIFHPSSAAPGEQTYPSKEEQGKLFEYLLHQFFQIEDLSERLERTAELLERFGGWFDIADVLALIPDTWSVELVSEFLVHSLRRLVQERNETVVVKALSSSQSLRQSVEVIDKVEAMGATVFRESEAISPG